MSEILFLDNGLGNCKTFALAASPPTEGASERANHPTMRTLQPTPRRAPSQGGKNFPSPPSGRAGRGREDSSARVHAFENWREGKTIPAAKAKAKAKAKESPSHINRPSCPSAV